MDATDIVDVVKDFVMLRKAGVNYKGLCPFHNEKTPSFVVSPSKQLCKCFSCGKGGNAVHFLMELEQMTYPEAIKWLGNKYGIEVREKELTNEERLLENERESMFILNEWAGKYFTDVLLNDVDGVAQGLKYFRQRGFRDDTIRKFGLGFSPTDRTAMGHAALARGYRREYLLKTGLCYETDDHRLVDRYHGRVIFPVHTVSGKIVAFGGRILSSDKSVAKYVNSPESLIYSKSHQLYGLYQAKQAIVKAGCCYLVEGYTDVISMHQSGVENVVASSGTSLTEGQIRLLHRFTDHITVLYDGDAAGIKASLRGIDMLLKEGLTIKVLLLPDGEDPDSFARAHSAAEFRQYIETHQTDFIRFKTRLLLDTLASDDPVQRAALVSDIVRSISVIPDAIVRQMYVSESARLLSVSENLIAYETDKLRRAMPRADERRTPSAHAPRLPEVPAPGPALPPAPPVSAAPVAGEAVPPLPADVPPPPSAEPLAVEPPTGVPLPPDVPPAEADLPPASPPAEPATALPGALSRLQQTEYALMRMIVKYGELPLRTDTADADTTSPASADGAQTVTVSVAKYIADSLADDDIRLANPTDALILEEAVREASLSADWKALPYFTLHPDLAISRFASAVAEDEEPLSSRQQALYVSERYRLDEVVPRLLHDYKYSLICRQKEDLLRQLADPQLSQQPEKARALMEQYMQLIHIERQFALLLGDRVVVKPRLR